MTIHRVRCEKINNAFQNYIKMLISYRQGLFSDEKVWVGGSRKFSNPQNFEFENDMERRIEIYRPGYLLEGPGPVITSAPLVIKL